MNSDPIVGRREFLRFGTAAFGGLGLVPLLPHHADAANLAELATGKSVVFVFMHGGPSQIETFDPKMTAPRGISSVTGEVSTAIPGVTFGGTFPRLAGLADRFSIVRSFQTLDGNHDIKPIVGKATSGASLGSMYSRVVGTNREHSGMPTNVALYPRAVDSSTMPAIKQFGDFESTGPLGGGFAPFAPSGDGPLQNDMKLQIPMDRLGDRQSLLRGLDQVRREVDVSPYWDGLESLRHQAFSTILGGAAKAFDLSEEDPKTIARYDTAPLVRPDQINKRWNNYERYVDNAKSLGKLMLLSRRLCEHGAGFVMVTTNFVWDMHSDQNNAGPEEGMGYVGLPFDHAISAFLEDLHARGLSDKILLVCCGEMGRTPKINARGGRDHWGGLAPLMLAGAGIPEGHVVGQSTRDASQPLTSPIRIPNLVSTVLHTLLDGPQLRLKTEIPSEIIRAMDVDPVL